MKNILLFCFCFLLIKDVYSNEYVLHNIQKQTTIVYDYELWDSDVNSRMIVKLNNHKYRESVIKGDNIGIFALSLNPGTYYSSFEIEGYGKHYFETYQVNGNLLYGENHLQDIIIKKDWKEIDKKTFKIDKKGEIDILSSINGISNNSNMSIVIELDGKEILNKITHKNSFRYKDKLNVEEGIHNLVIKGKSDNIVCVCPSINDGYEYSNFLGIIINKDNTKKLKYNETNKNIKFVLELNNNMNSLSYKNYETISI